MKKIIISILTVSFLILSGCYKGENTVTVKINLQNLHGTKSAAPVSFLAKLRSFFVKNAFAADPNLFIAAEKGSEILTTLALNYDEVSANGNTVELEVPAGDDITILVVGTYEGTNYGCEKVNLEAGKTENVTITLDYQTWCDNETCSKQIYTSTNPVSWDTPGPGVVAKYYIRDYSGNILYEGYDNKATTNSCYNYLDVEFIPFNVKIEGTDSYTSPGAPCK